MLYIVSNLPINAFIVILNKMTGLSTFSLLILNIYLEI